MKQVFVLQHVHELDGAEEVKLIGVYDTEDGARAAMKRASGLPGFADHPDGFSIDGYELGRDHWTDGFRTVAPSGKRIGPPAGDKRAA